MPTQKSSTKTKRRWLSLNVKRMRLKSKRTFIFSTLSDRFRASSPVKTAFTRRRRLNCNRRSTGSGRSLQQKERSIKLLNRTWSSASKSSTKSTKRKKLSVKLRLLALRMSAMRLRSVRHGQMKKFRLSWSTSRKTLRTARGATKSKPLRMKQRSRRSRKECRWTMLPGTSNVAGIGSKPKASSSLRRVKKAAKARKRRRSDH